MRGEGGERVGIMIAIEEESYTHICMCLNICMYLERERER